MSDEYLRNWFREEVGLWGDYLGQYGKKKVMEKAPGWDQLRPVMRFSIAKRGFYSRLSLDKATMNLIKFFNSIK